MEKRRQVRLERLQKKLEEKKKQKESEESKSEKKKKTSRLTIPKDAWMPVIVQPPQKRQATGREGGLASAQRLLNADQDKPEPTLPTSPTTTAPAPEKEKKKKEDEMSLTDDQRVYANKVMRDILHMTTLDQKMAEQNKMLQRAFFVDIYKQRLGIFEECWKVRGSAGPHALFVFYDSVEHWINVVPYMEILPIPLPSLASASVSASVDKLSSHPAMTSTSTSMTTSTTATISVGTMYPPSDREKKNPIKSSFTRKAAPAKPGIALGSSSHVSCFHMPSYADHLEDDKTPWSWPLPWTHSITDSKSIPSSSSSLSSSTSTGEEKKEKQLGTVLITTRGKSIWLSKTFCDRVEKLDKSGQEGFCWIMFIDQVSFCMSGTHLMDTPEYDIVSILEDQKHTPSLFDRLVSSSLPRKSDPHEDIVPLSATSSSFLSLSTSAESPDEISRALNTIDDAIRNICSPPSK